MRSIVIAGAFVHGHTDTILTLIEPLWTGTPIHRHIVSAAALTFQAKGLTCVLALLKLVGESLGIWAAFGVFLCICKTHKENKVNIC